VAQIFTGMIMVKKIIAVLLGTLIIYFGFCLVIKAGVGLDAWDALLLTVSAVLGMKVGTLAILFSIILIAGQLVMEGRNFRPVQLLQLLSVFFGGNILNYFVYSLFCDLRFKSYPLRIVIATFSYLLIALGVIIIMESRLIRNPLEGFCQVVTDKCGGRMGHLRQMCDWVFMAIVLILSFSFKTEITIREGTIICMVIFGPALDFLRNPVRKGMNKLSM
jgi:uncharacterized protein